jgi:hypothetical protein
MAVFSGNGSAGSPSFTFSSDTNLGMYRADADKLGFSVNGSGRMFLDSSGRLLVGISTTTGSGEELLIVRGAVSNHDLAAQISLRRGQAVVAAGTDIGQINFQAANADYKGAWIRARSQAGWSVGSSHPTYLQFNTTESGSATPTEKVRITSTGELRVNNFGSDGNGYGLTVGQPTGGSGGVRGISQNNLFGTAGSAGYIIARGLGGGSGASVIDTGISINQSIGKTLFVVASRNTSSGTSTDSAAYLVQFYQSGNNTPAVTFIAGDANFVTFGVSGSNTLTVTGNSGNWTIGCIST